MSRVLTMVLAGGEGKRLHPLTAERAKPAVPFGGRYRLIDFVLSNIANSGLLHVKVLTQYKSDSLIRHLSHTWNLTSLLGHYIDVVPAQMRTGREWFKGSADAIFQNFHLIHSEKPDLVAIFNADHIYRMDVRQMILYHLEKDAELTIATVPVQADKCSEFGIVRSDDEGRVAGYEEKPASAAAGPDGTVTASMGNYIFNTKTLLDVVAADAASNSSHDLASSVVAGIWASRRVYAYDFRTNYVSGMNESDRGYWRDVGTLDAYFEAQMNLVSVTPAFSLYNDMWPIHAYPYMCPPAKFVFADESNNRVGVATDSLVCEGAIISGGRVVRSIISPKVRVNSYSSIDSAVLMDGVQVGRRCRIKRAIVDKNVVIPPGTVIGYDLDADRKRFFVSPGGVVVIPKGYVFA